MVLARVVIHVLARVLLHVLARVIIHVHDYYSKTCFPATRRFSMSSTALVGLSRFIKTSQVVQLAFPLTQLPGQTFSQCLGLILAPALLIWDVPRMNMVSECKLAQFCF